MSGEDLASSYSFGEYDDFSEFDVLPENDNDSVSLYEDPGTIPKSNILILSDIQESFVVLGRDILKSIKDFSCDENPESTRSSDCEEYSESGTSSAKEAKMPNKILTKWEEVEDALKINKKTPSNLKHMTERFRSTSSPLLYDSNSASPSNEAFFSSTAKNHTQNGEIAAERQNKLLREIKQILQQKAKHESEKKVQKSKMRDNFDHFSESKIKVTPVVDSLNRKFKGATKATKLLDCRDPHLRAEMKLKNSRESLNVHSKKLSATSSTKSHSVRPIHENAENVKIRELKKAINESLLDGSNIDKRSKQLLCNFKNSIEIFENSNQNSKKNPSFESSSNGNEFNNLKEHKGLVEKINMNMLNSPIVISYTICIVFMIFMYFFGVILLDMLKMCDKIIDTTTRIDKFAAFNMGPEFDFFTQKSYS